MTHQSFMIITPACHHHTMVTFSPLALCSRLWVTSAWPGNGILNCKLRLSSGSAKSSLSCVHKFGNSNIAITILHCNLESALGWKHSVYKLSLSLSVSVHAHVHGQTWDSEPPWMRLGARGPGSDGSSCSDGNFSTATEKYDKFNVIQTFKLWTKRKTESIGEMCVAVNTYPN